MDDPQQENLKQGVRATTERLKKHHGQDGRDRPLEEYDQHNQEGKTKDGPAYLGLAFIGGSGTDGAQKWLQKTNALLCEMP
jgi:hypothetical protein